MLAGDFLGSGLTNPHFLIEEKNGDLSVRLPSLRQVR